MRLFLDIEEITLNIYLNCPKSLQGRKINMAHLDVGRNTFI